VALAARMLNSVVSCIVDATISATLWPDATKDPKMELFKSFVMNEIRRAISICNQTYRHRWKFVSKE
jgi:hypothetical protein